MRWKSNIRQFLNRISVQLTKIPSSLLINIEKTLNRLITKFYGVNVIAAELRLSKTGSRSFNEKQCQQMQEKFGKLNLGEVFVSFTVN